MTTILASTGQNSAAAPRSTAPFSPFEWVVARRYLGATRTGKGVSLISIIAFVGVMLAVSVLIIVMSIMQGFRSKLLDQLLGVNGHAWVSADQPIKDFEALSARLLAVPGVKSAAPLIQRPVFATASGEAGMFIRGMRREDLMKLNYVTGQDHVLSGSFETFGVGRNGGDEIALGSRLAGSLGVGVGDPVTLIAGRGADTPFGPTLQRKTYRVGAIFDIGNYEYDGFIGFMPLEQAQLFFKLGSGVQEIELKLDRPADVKEIRPALEKAAEGHYIRDWQQQSRSYFNALQMERTLMRAVLFFILIVAALNIITGLIMLVKDKTGDIAILRTIGATSGSIMRIFFLAGSSVGVLGALAGLALGTLFIVNIDPIENFLSAIFGFDIFPAEVYYFDGVPAEMQAGEIAIVVGGALLMSFVSTLYPAWRAARLDPVDALRYK